MIKWNIQIKGLEKGKKLTLEGLRRVLQKSMFKMEELAINNAPVDQNEIRQGISVFPEILSNKYVLKSTAGHSAAMEYGTRPFYAPIDPLKSWAARKLGDENLAYPVRAKIAKLGITAQPFMRPALSQVKNYWFDVFLEQEFPKQK